MPIYLSDPLQNLQFLLPLLQLNISLGIKYVNTRKEYLWPHLLGHLWALIPWYCAVELFTVVKGEPGIRPASTDTFLTAYVYPSRQQQQ